MLLPSHGADEPLDPLGIAYALAAACLWALCILSGQRAGKLPGRQAVPIGLMVGAALVLPVGIAHAGAWLLRPDLVSALAVAVLSSAVPYSLEMVGLRALPRRTFGILLSLEPVVGSLMAMGVLGERLALVQWVAVGCIVVASIGALLG